MGYIHFCDRCGENIVETNKPNLKLYVTDLVSTMASYNYNSNYIAPSVNYSYDLCPKCYVEAPVEIEKLFRFKRK